LGDLVDVVKAFDHMAFESVVVYDEDDTLIVSANPYHVILGNSLTADEYKPLLSLFGRYFRKCLGHGLFRLTLLAPCFEPEYGGGEPIPLLEECRPRTVVALTNDARVCAKVVPPCEELVVPCMIRIRDAYNELRFRANQIFIWSADGRIEYDLYRAVIYKGKDGNYAVRFPENGVPTYDGAEELEGLPIVNMPGRVLIGMDAEKIRFRDGIEISRDLLDVDNLMCKAVENVEHSSNPNEPGEEEEAKVAKIIELCQSLQFGYSLIHSSSEGMSWTEVIVYVDSHEDEEGKLVSVHCSRQFAQGAFCATHKLWHERGEMGDNTRRHYSLEAFKQYLLLLVARRAETLPSWMMHVQESRG
jgi:hypothetical protein